MVDQLAGDSGSMGLALDRLMRLFGRALNDLVLYGRDHSVTATILRECHAAVAEWMATSGELDIALADRELMGNGIPIPARTPPVQALIARLRDLEVQRVSLKPGLTLPELESLIIVLGSPAAEIEQSGGFDKVLTLLGVNHVTMRRAHYALVEDGQVVTSADQVGGGASAAPPPPPAAPPLPDAATLARQVLESSRPDDLENLAGRIMGSLQQCYATICAGGVLETQKGRRQTVRTIQDLSKILDTQLPGDLSAPDREQIQDALDGMVDEVMVESLTEDYLKRRKLFEEKEARLLRYLKKADASPERAGVLRERLVAGGLDAGACDALLRRGQGADRGGAAAAGASGSEAPLPELFQEMAGFGPAALENVVERDRMVALLRTMDAEVSRLTAATEARIEALEADLRAAPAPPGAPGDRAPRMSQNTLAEIVQELCQPLSVVKCAVSVALRHGGDKLADPLRDALQMAGREAERLEGLVNRLSSLSGVPESLTPDLDVRRSFYT